MDDKGRLLLAATRRRAQPERGARLGQCARAYLDEQHARFRKNCPVVDVWREALPTKLYEHCRLAGIKGGVLRLVAEPGPYMHEIRVVSSELLKHIQGRCRGAGIKKIVVVAGSCEQVKSEDERP